MTLFYCVTLGGAILILFVGGVVLWRRFPRIAPSAPDPYLEAVAAHCWKTGKMVVGSVDEDGKLTIKEIGQRQRTGTASGQHWPDQGP